MLFLQKRFPEHNFELIHIAQRIRKIENDDATFNEILDKIDKADAVI